MHCNIYSYQEISSFGVWLNVIPTANISLKDFLLKRYRRHIFFTNLSKLFFLCLSFILNFFKKELQAATSFCMKIPINSSPVSLAALNSQITLLILTTAQISNRH